MLTSKDLTGVKFLISAGPTEEYIDPVRCLTNRSTGKNGLCPGASRQTEGRGSHCGQRADAPFAALNVDVVKVTSALQMRDAIAERFPLYDVLIKAAAVSDFRPAGGMIDHKVKKKDAPSR